MMAAGIETVVTVTSELDKDNADTDKDAATAISPKKKKKCQQRHKDIYAQEYRYTWVMKSRKDQFHAYCRHCPKDISIGCGGLSDLKSHLTSWVYKSNAEARKTNQMLSALYASKKHDNMDRNNARAAAEVAIVYHTVVKQFCRTIAWTAITNWANCCLVSAVQQNEYILARQKLNLSLLVFCLR